MFERPFAFRAEEGRFPCGRDSIPSPIAPVHQQIRRTGYVLPAHEQVQIPGRPQGQVAIERGGQDRSLEWNDRNSFLLQAIEDVPELSGQAQVVSDIFHNPVMELRSDDIGDSAAFDGPQVPRQEWAHPMGMRHPKQVWPIELLGKQRPDPLGPFCVHVGAGATEEQLLFGLPWPGFSRHPALRYRRSTDAWAMSSSTHRASAGRALRSRGRLSRHTDTQAARAAHWRRWLLGLTPLRSRTP